MMNSKTGLRLLISAGALALLAMQFSAPRLRLDAVALGLVVLAVLPWLSSIIESAKLPGGWEVKFRVIEGEQAKQREELDMMLRFLLENFVSAYELVHLEKLAGGTPFPFSKSGTFEAELRRLLALGLIERRPGKGIRSLFKSSDDVQRHLEITARGREYLQYRLTLGRPNEREGSQ
jgi:hypothetical protein